MDAAMRFASASTNEAEIEKALDALIQEFDRQATGQRPDLALAFLSAHFTRAAREIVTGLRAALNPRVLLGCTAEGVIGRDREIEGGAGIALVGAQLPGVTFSPFILRPAASPLEFIQEEEFRRDIDAPADTRLFILLGDPFTMPMSDVLSAFNAFYPQIPVIGGMASGGLRPGGNLLFLDDQLLEGGAIGAGLSGALEIDLIVSQGCRPIWQPMTVTAAQKNVIHSLEGQPPLAVIQDLIPELSEEDRFLLQSGLFIGRAIDSSRERLGRGDFLVRGVVGVDRQTGAIAIGDYVQDGETVQFHLRDAVTAQEDLEMMLIPQMFRDPPCGGLLFSCNGRGTRLYDRPDGDISIIQKSLGGIPFAGLFCAGEIGPVGGENFLHGHTASLVLFRQ
jgi:small ligand-binding sensory domain FIST